MDKKLKFAVLPGDGIGPEVMESALEVLETVLNGSGWVTETQTADIGGGGD